MGGRVLSVGEIVSGDRTLMDPDILVIPERFPLTANRSEIDEWWLAVEVLSPGSRIYDRELKCPAYLSLGVHEVWLVDLDARLIERHRTDWPTPRREIGTLRWIATPGHPPVEIKLTDSHPIHERFNSRS